MRCLLFTSLLLAAATPAAAAVTLDESPADDRQWGYRPPDTAVLDVSPPNFSWRPQSGIATWELECGEEADFEKTVYKTDGISFNVHTPPHPLAPGRYTWRYRGVTEDGEKTDWSTSRSFTIPETAAEMPMPAKGELLARIPTSHPRLFVRPEDLPRLRRLAGGPMSDRFEDLVAHCERLLENPPPTEEPPKYPPGTERLSERWREIWWGNREYTIDALNGAATLAFTRLLGGKEEYGLLARRILLDCARWDPQGATGYRYNDEAGMPYAYYFARTYSFVNDLLSEEERELCRKVMKTRGDEMYRHLCPRHFWSPYSSHSNRAWHFLGEVGIAFLGEVEGADDWVWFAMNVFYNVYPVWSDEDGGWHEGVSYWNSYISRFTWWADVMRSAMGIDAYQKPYFSNAGFYPMYLMPPGKTGGGFGDLTARRTANHNVPLVSILAAQSGNSYWQWYVEAMGGPAETGGYVGFVRGTLPHVESKVPDDLPASRLFAGTGQAYLNTTLLDAGKDVQVVFKSSPFGTQSHGYEANNSFLLWAYGRRLLIRSGYRDIYGSDHHRNWMWSTRSVNNITVDGHGQVPHSASSKGRITSFATTPSVDVVVGEAGEAYRVEKSEEYPEGRILDRFTRAIIFVKPELVVVYDRLEARKAATFQYWLHSTEKFNLLDERNVELVAGDVVCPITFLAPDNLNFTQTDQYDPNPRPRIRLREWHLVAGTPREAESVEFIAVYRPHRKDAPAPRGAELRRVDGGYVLSCELSDGRAVALLPTQRGAEFSAEGLTSRGEIVVQRKHADGTAEPAVQVGY